MNREGEGTVVSSLSQKTIVEEGNSACRDGSCEKKSHGCFFRGCMGCLGFGILIILILVWLGIWWYHKLWNFAQEWTTTVPMEMPEKEVLRNREEIMVNLDKIQKGVQSETIDGFVIDQDMVDALLFSGDMYQYVDIDLGTGNIISVAVSAPLDTLNVEKLKGRYFNLILKGTYRYDHAGTKAIIHHLEIPGKEIPQVLLDELVGQDIWPSFYENDEYAQNMSKFESIILSWGKIWVEMRKE